MKKQFPRTALRGVAMALALAGLFGPASLVAGIDRLRGLGWGPLYDDLEEIVSQALRWETVLAERKAA